MTMASLKISLPDAEYTALARMADDDLRSLPDAARYALRVELVRRGLLNVPAAKAQPAEEVRDAAADER
jgi:hypothetical protein